MLDGEGLCHPQVELVSPFSAFRRPWRQAAPLPFRVFGTQGRPRERVGWLAVGWAGVEDRRRNTREWGRACWTGCPFSAFGSCCYACCYSRGSRPVVAVSRPVYVAISPPEIQEVRKARGERALWRVLTRADLSSQIEAPVGVEPTMADLQFLAHHARDVLRIASPASLTGLLLFLLLCSCGRWHRTT